MPKRGKNKGSGSSGSEHANANPPAKARTAVAVSELATARIANVVSALLSGSGDHPTRDPTAVLAGLVVRACVRACVPHTIHTPPFPRPHHPLPLPTIRMHLDAVMIVGGVLALTRGSGAAY